eukprot:TRINITY_DN12448_c0_g2_i1.p1 TRINITY_DN12448_c0_g2~~TRINITY_DN12448_c0_g2_i1.p1  ORF type:complete len:549 (-),score=149.24 TRINITY_DN12448_c0_g2_i1:23-1669(-)
MFALKSFAQSTIGELRGALTELDSEDEDEDDESPKKAESPKTQHSAKGDEPPLPAPSLPAQSASKPAVPASAPEAAASSSPQPSITVTADSSNGTVDASRVCDLPKPAALPQALAAPPAVPNERLAVPETLDSSASLPRYVPPSPGADVDASPTPMGLSPAVSSSATVTADTSADPRELEARRQVAALLEVPGLPDVLRRLPCSCHAGGAAEGEAAAGCTACIWAAGADVDGFPLAAAVAQCAEALRLLAPRLLADGAEQNGSDTKRLLSSFAERYDVLFAKFGQLQTRLAEVTVQNERLEAAARDAAAWQKAQDAAMKRVEALSLENADLKERLKYIQSRSSDVQELETLQRKLVQRETECLKAGEALRQLQEVIDSGSAVSDDKHSEIARELADTRRKMVQQRTDCEAEVAKAQEAQKEAQKALDSTASLAQRCEASEREAADTAEALEALLREKERHLEERANFVDRRLVHSMLTLYKDHSRNNRDSAIAEQVLGQTLHILASEGNGSASTERQRFFEDAAKARQRAGPLSDAFLDFLSKETGEE